VIVGDRTADFRFLSLLSGKRAPEQLPLDDEMMEAMLLRSAGFDPQGFREMIAEQPARRCEGTAAA
jgi:hypothetical protein